MATLKNIFMFVFGLLFIIAQAGAIDEDCEDCLNDDYEIDEGEDEEEVPSIPPTILTEPLNFTIRIGENLTLPCDVKDLGNIVLLWKRDTSVLMAGQIRITRDDRISVMMNNTNLHITNVGPKDSGKYECKLGMKDTVGVIHTVNILAPPVIVKVIPDNYKVLKKGDPVTLQCEVTGYPPPEVVWTRKGKKMPNGEDTTTGFSITIDSANRHHSGLYMCTAENGVGEAVSETINLHVAFAPEIEVDKEAVNSREGFDAELTCTVHAEPKAKVLWYKDGNLLNAHDRYVTVQESSNKFTLHIKDTKEEDFGNYSCFANNSHGRSTKVIELTGLPSQAVFQSDSVTGDGQNARLEWIVESYTPVTDFQLRYRRVKAQEDWMYIEVPVTEPEGHIYTGSYFLRNLTPSSEYEVIVLSQNKYGWSKVSKNYKFSTDYQSHESDAAAAEPSAEETSVGDGAAFRFSSKRLVPLVVFLSIFARSL